MVTFKIVALQKDMGFAKKAFVRISGEIYDSQARRFINSYEVPRLEFPIQTELIEDVGDKKKFFLERISKPKTEELTQFRI